MTLMTLPLPQSKGKAVAGILGSFPGGRAPVVITVGFDAFEIADAARARDLRPQPGTMRHEDRALSPRPPAGVVRGRPQLAAAAVATLSTRGWHHRVALADDGFGVGAQTNARDGSKVEHELALRPELLSPARMPPTAQRAPRGERRELLVFDCGAGAVLLRA
jgi:hypothetical protein